jgi:hypothetical protein
VILFIKGSIVRNKTLLVLLVMMCCLVYGCKRPAVRGTASAASVSELGQVEIYWVARVGNQALKRDTVYRNALGESFSLKQCQAFISEIALANSARGEVSPRYDQAGNGVHLVDFLSPDTACIRLTFPVGAYQDLRMVMGVPRALNHADPSTARYPLNGEVDNMFWEWNSGYIFFLLDGNTSANADNMLHQAIGGDSRMMPLRLGNLFDREPLLQVRPGKKCRIYMELNLLELWKNQDLSHVRFSSIPQAIVHGGPEADQLRLNLLQAIRVQKVE